MLKLKLQYFGHLMQRTDPLERPWCWERLKAEGEGANRGSDGCIASSTQWTWVWASPRRWWWTGRPGGLQSVGLQRVRRHWATEQNIPSDCLHLRCTSCPACLLLQPQRRQTGQWRLCQAVCSCDIPGWSVREAPDDATHRCRGDNASKEESFERCFMRRLTRPHGMENKQSAVVTLLGCFTRLPTHTKATRSLSSSEVSGQNRLGTQLSFFFLKNMAIYLCLVCPLPEFSKWYKFFQVFWDLVYPAVQVQYL